MDAISRTRASEIHPKLSSIVQAMDTALSEQGLSIRIVQGLRTVGEQNTLYAMGRTAGGQRVTNAKGGWSAHNFGYAVDIVPGLRNTSVWMPNWDEQSDDFQAMLKAGTGLGLVSGASWGDFDHFQLPGLPVTPTDDMREVLFNEGLKAFWAKYITE